MQEMEKDRNESTVFSTPIWCLIESRVYPAPVCCSVATVVGDKGQKEDNAVSCAYFRLAIMQFMKD